MKRILFAALACAFVLPATAFAGDLTLHPRGFGEDTYVSWKAKSGEPDSTGAAFQSLYFQKFALTATPVSAIAEIKGLAGTPADQLEGLAWDHRTDGRCGAGSPRWIVVYDTNGTQGFLVLGCAAADHQQLAASSGHGWCRDTQPSSAFDTIPPGSTLAGLFILFDEGPDNGPNPPPLGCDQEQPEGGFTYLDNITVTLDGEDNVFTSAADNGNG